jgi:hypothetical protein
MRRGNSARARFKEMCLPISLIALGLDKNEPIVCSGRDPESAAMLMSVQLKKRGASKVVWMRAGRKLREV